MNGRTALGAGLVLLAVLAGALFLDRSQRLVPVYAAARDLPAGTSLQEGDVVVIRARLPATALRRYLRPSIDRQVSGRVLTAPVQRETLIPAGVVLASGRDADLVELPVQVDPGDMAQGLRPGDSVQVLAAYTEGARRGRAVVLLPSAEVVQVFQDPAGLTGAGQDRGVQLRMPSDRAPVVAAAIATARIFVVKAPGPATDETAASPPTPGSAPEPPSDASPSGSSPSGSSPSDASQPDGSRSDPAQPDAPPSGSSQPGSSPTDTSGPGGSLSGGGRSPPTSSYEPGGVQPGDARPRGGAV
jgi:hypothetical protein